MLLTMEPVRGLSVSRVPDDIRKEVIKLNLAVTTPAPSPLS